MNVLVVVDLQNDFIDGVLGTKEALAIVDYVKAKIKDFDGQIIFTRDTHSLNYLSTEEGKNLPIPHCIKGTKGWEIREGLVKENSIIIDKETFGSVALGKKLEEMDKKERIENVTLLGLCTDICVISNALLCKAFLPNAHIIVDSKGSSGVTSQSHETALSSMKACQIEII